MCNSNFTDVYVPSEEPPQTATVPPRKDHSMTIITWTALGALFTMFMFMVGVGVYYFWKRTPKKCDVEAGHPMPPPPDYSLDKLKLINIIGKFFFGRS